MRVSITSSERRLMEAFSNSFNQKKVAVKVNPSNVIPVAPGQDLRNFDWCGSRTFRFALGNSRHLSSLVYFLWHSSS